MTTQPDTFGPFTLRDLGTTGLRVTPLCVGCAPLGSLAEFVYEVAEEQALATIRAIFTGPINFLDTAASYGESERRLGLVMRELGGLPPHFVLATKADRDFQTNDFSGAQMRRSVERSLELLGLDRLQLLYLHDPEYIALDDPVETAFAETMKPGGAVEALLRCKEEGLIDHLGIAGGPIDMLVRFVETGLFEVAISHNRYTLLEREAAGLWDACQSYHVAAMNAAPYGSGILAKGPAVYPRYMYDQASETTIRRVQRMEAACARAGVPLAAAALQFSLRDPRITSTIAGLSRPARLAETVALAQQQIPVDLWKELDEIFQTEV